MKHCLIIAALFATALAQSSDQDVRQEKVPDTLATAFPCLSSDHKFAGKICRAKAKEEATLQTEIPHTAGSTFCYVKCILEQLKAIDSSNKVNTAALIAVISVADLTETQKANAIKILKTCLLDTKLSAMNIMGGCKQPADGPPFEAPKVGSDTGVKENVEMNDKARPLLYPLKTSQECSAYGKDLGCLGKALSMNNCGPKCLAGTLEVIV